MIFKEDKQFSVDIRILQRTPITEGLRKMYSYYEC
jgi:hypothetical protein